MVTLGRLAVYWMATVLDGFFKAKPPGAETGLRVKRQKSYFGGLDILRPRSKIPKISGKKASSFGWPVLRLPSGVMNPTAVATPYPRRNMNQCKHPRVQIVSRDEDTEYVECLECGEVFESSEFKDMAIEERAQSEEV